ncbi:MAG: glycosyltransferase [Acidimicrobiia bacterium]|nr:glycosyltransferase [Acidimicrobiia bacterium]
MALLDPARSDTPTAPASVAVLVFIHEGSALRDALEAVERQVYEPEVVLVVGGAIPDGQETPPGWVANLAEAQELLDDSITDVWLLHDDSIPRPDALGALLREGRRAEADLVGSKILVAGRPGRLESVGLATDVFEVPASGLDSDEVDQEQYDVLRDVAFVAGSSILMRRSMLDRVGGADPLLEPVTAAVDLCQRVRLAGGRVVVVPSAEVLHDGTCAAESKPWRLEAGRLRAMLKAYSPLTLAWVVPFNFVLGLLEAIVSPFYGRWRLFAFLRAWVWNIWRLPSTLAARRKVVRSAGDDELFRFQVRGSARLTRFWQRVAESMARLASSEQARSLGRVVESGQDTVRRPVVASLLAGVAFAVFASRELWLNGIAAAGNALSPPRSVSDAVQAYAGGWNPADLGSPEPLRPVIGLVSLVQTVLLGRASLTMAVLLVGGAVAGVVGMSRLLGPFGVRPAARYGAGILLIAGPAVRVFAGDGLWTGLVAMALLPWILAVVMHRRSTRAAIASAGLLTALAAALSPAFLLLPTVVALVWSLVQRGNPARLLGRTLAAAGLAIPALLPWIGTIDEFGFLVRSGPDFFWSPSMWVVVATASVAGAVMAAGSDAMHRLAGWGALLAAGGALLARTGSFGWGTEAGSAGMAAAGLGIAIIAGSGLEAGAGAFQQAGAPRYLLLGAAGFAVALLVGTTTLALPGRLGFPSTGLTETLVFTSEATPGRALLLGDEQPMPGGGHRLTDTLAFRVVSTPEPSMTEAWTTPPLAGEIALEEALMDALSGGGFRLGEQLADFGIGWIVTFGEDPALSALDAQLDLIPLAIPDVSAYQVEPAAPRAIDNTGTEWLKVGTTYVGPGGERTVRLAENADVRWGSEWEQAGWQNLVTEASGMIEFGPIATLRRAALVGLVWSGLLVVGAAAFREERA